uniref:ZP domain-containing protein n=1 Tax=Plectus sambesii TaxID=2011161 RepID=A0A914WCW7_9BILA
MRAAQAKVLLGTAREERTRRSLRTGRPRTADARRISHIRCPIAGHAAQRSGCHRNAVNGTPYAARRTSRSEAPIHRRLTTNCCRTIRASLPSSSPVGGALVDDSRHAGTRLRCARKNDLCARGAPSADRIGLHVDTVDTADQRVSVCPPARNMAESSATAVFALVLLLFASVLGENDLFRAKLICLPTHMEVFIDYTNGKFSGVVYTEGSYDNPDCFRTIEQSSKIVIEVPYDGCKTIDDAEVYTNTVIIQHHRRIMTSDDAAFKVSCDKRNMQSGAEVMVTETMYMVHDKNKYNYDGKYNVDEDAKSQLKYSQLNKKQKTIETNKGTMVYVSVKNASRTVIEKY